MTWRPSLPTQLIGVVLGVFLLGNFIPDDAVSGLYAISLLIKELLVFFLPYIVFIFVVDGILAFKKNAPQILTITLAMIFISNGIVALLAYGVAYVAVPILTAGGSGLVVAATQQVEPLFVFTLPRLVRSEAALVAAVVIGVLSAVLGLTTIKQLTHRGKLVIGTALKYILIPILPLYVAGFLLKIQHEGALDALFGSYGPAVLLIITFQFCYLTWLFLLASSFSVTQARQFIQNSVPTYLTGFGTMSSTATIPVALETAYKNGVFPGLAHMAIPIMANVHLLGDSICTPLLALTTLAIFKGTLPTLGAFVIFVAYFCVTMFAASGIPGGGIVVMIPLLISQFGFTSEMISLITTVYLLLDSFGTATNITGDGAMTIILQRILMRLKLIEPEVPENLARI